MGTSGATRPELLRGAPGLWAQSRFRRTRASSIFLVFFAGFGGIASMTAIEVARRDATVIDRFLSYSAMPEISFLAGCPKDLADSDSGRFACVKDDITVQVRDAALAQPDVVSATRAAIAVLGAMDSTPSSDWSRWLGVAHVDDPPDPARELPALGRPIIVSGRLPRAGSVDEVAVDEAGATAHGYRIGSTMTLAAYTAHQTSEAGNGSVPPNGPQQLVTVVGIVREALLVFQPAVPDSEVESIYTQAHFLFLSSAWWRAQHDDAFVYGVGTFAHLRPGASADAVLQAISDSRPTFTFGSDSSVDNTLALRNTVDLQSNAALLVGLVGIVASLVFVGQAIVRQANRDLDDGPVLMALGMVRKTVAVGAVLRWLPIALGAAAIAVVGAVLLSPIGPIGAGRIAEPSPGIHLDWPVLAIGFAGVALTVVVCGLLPTLAFGRVKRTHSARSGKRAGARLASQISGGPKLLDSPGQRRTLSIGIACVAIAVGCFVASAGLVTSLAALVDHPDRYGAAWDFAVGNASSEQEADAQIETAKSLSHVISAASALLGSDSVDLGLGSGSGSLQTYQPVIGDLGAVILEGRAPTALNEIALGRLTLRDAGLHIGDQVEGATSADGQPVAPLTIVGVAAINDGQGHGPGRGAVVTPATFAVLDPLNASAQFILVRINPAVARRDALAALNKAYQNAVTRPISFEVHNYDRSSSTLTFITAFVLLLAVGAIASALITIIRSRRHDVGVLRAIGFTSGQVSATIAREATAIAVFALVLGVPLGLIVERWTWRFLLDRIGLNLTPTTSWWAIGIAAIVTIFVTNLIAFPPGRRAGRAVVGELLATE